MCVYIYIYIYEREREFGTNCQDNFFLMKFVKTIEGEPTWS